MYRSLSSQGSMALFMGWCTLGQVCVHAVDLELPVHSPLCEKSPDMSTVGEDLASFGLRRLCIIFCPSRMISTGLWHASPLANTSVAC